MPWRCYERKAAYLAIKTRQKQGISTFHSFPQVENPYISGLFGHVYQKSEENQGFRGCDETCGKYNSHCGKTVEKVENMDFMP